MTGVGHDHDLLGAFDLSDAAEEAYTRLLLGETRRAPAEAVDELRAEGLLHEIDGSHYALPLGQAYMRRRMRANLADANLRAALHAFTSTAGPTGTGGAGDAQIEVIRGGPASLRRYMHEVAGATTSLRTLERGPYFAEQPQERSTAATAGDASAVLDDASGGAFAGGEPGSATQTGDLVAELVGRGVQVRSVYLTSLMRNPAVLRLLSAVGEAGEESRHHRDVPLWTAIIDDRVGLLSMPRPTPTGPQAGVHDTSVLVTEAPELVALLSRVFETYWERGVPIDTAVRAGDEAADETQLIAALGMGATDAVIASTLGLSTRTLQRRIQHLMRRYDCRTRLQLGAELQRRGLL